MVSRAIARQGVVGGARRLAAVATSADGGQGEDFAEEASGRERDRHAA
jgi:hypothetical protein